MRSWSVTGWQAVLVDGAARFDPSQHAIDQSGDTKLGSDKPFDWSNLADIHPEDTRSVGQGGDKIQRIVPAQTTGLGSAERRNQRSIKPVAIERQVDRPTTGLHH